MPQSELGHYETFLLPLTPCANCSSVTFGLLGSPAPASMSPSSESSSHSTTSPATHIGGRYYTLREIAGFDGDGLRSWQSVWILSLRHADCHPGGVPQPLVQRLTRPELGRRGVGRVAPALPTRQVSRQQVSGLCLCTSDAPCKLSPGSLMRPPWKSPPTN